MTEHKQMPALYYHCEAAYDTLLAEANYDEVDTTGQVTWEGSFTHLVTERLNLSVPYYSTITRALKGMGCIRQIRRGGGNSNSLWELITPPTEELFDKLAANDNMPKAKSKVEAVRKELRTMEKRLDLLEDNIIKVLNYFQEHYESDEENSN